MLLTPEEVGLVEHSQKSIIKYNKISDLYPHPYEPKEGLWDNWQPL